jgi:hypothetical protein
VLGCIVGARAANKTPFFGEVITSRRSQKLADHRVREQAVAGKDAIADDDERIEKSGAPCCFADRLNLGRPLRYRVTPAGGVLNARQPRDNSREILPSPS